MTALTDAKAITPTANAKAVVQTKGADITSLMQLVQQRCNDLIPLVRYVINVTPSGDANLTALQALLTELS